MPIADLSKFYLGLSLVLLWYGLPVTGDTGRDMIKNSDDTDNHYCITKIHPDTCSNETYTDLITVLIMIS